jgi:hypothetical protein
LSPSRSAGHDRLPARGPVFGCILTGLSILLQSNLLQQVQQPCCTGDSGSPLMLIPKAECGIAGKLGAYFSSSRMRYASASFIIDRKLRQSIRDFMVSLRPSLLGMRRILLATVVACLAFLHALNSGFFALERVHFAAGTGPSVAIAGEICRTARDEGRGQPGSPHPSHCHHCILCTIGVQSALDAVGVLASVLFLYAPRSDAAPAWFLREARAIRLSGDGSAWTSGVPPPIS